KYIDGISIKATKDGKVVTPDSKKKFFADIKENMITLYVARAKQDRGSFATSSDNVLGSRELIQAGKTYKYTFKDEKNPNPSYKDMEYEISFRLKSVESLDKAENTQFLIAYVAGTTSGDPCADKKPVTWKATFTSYDADKYGGVTDQKSVDPISGEVQEKTIPIQITCDTAANLKAKGAEPEAPPEKKYAIMEAKLIDAEGDENLLSLDKATKIIPGDYKLKVKTSSEEGLVILYENLGLDRTDKEHTYAWDLDLTELGKSNVTVKYVVNDKVEDKKNYVVEVVSPVEILREGEEPAISGIGTVTVGGKEVRPRATISVLPGKDQIITIEVAGDIDDILVKDITGADFATMAGIPPEFAGTMDIEPGKKYEFFVEVYKDKKLIDSDKYVIEGFNITPEIPTASLSMNDLSKDSKNPTQINPLVYDWLIIPSLSGAAKVNVVIYNSRKGFFTTSFGTAYDQTVEPRHVSYFAYDIDLTKESAYYIKADYLNSGGSVIQTEERYVETNPNQIQSVSLIPPAGMPDLPKGIIDPKQIAESNPAVLPYEYVLDVRTLSPGAVFCKIKGDSVVEEEFMPDQIAGTTHQLKADFQKLYTGDLVYTLTCSLKNVDNQLVSQWRAQFFDEQIITVGGKRVYCSIVNSCEDYTQYTTVEFCNEDVCNKFNKECKWLGTKCEHRPPLSCANVKECKDYGAFWEDCNANTCKLATSCFWAPISQQCMVKTA
ncbi:hypothetical protein KY310_01700, partial [Candidatus Woesearchaeota archaeon]|nr:hypothetical protein [Candidatus Woesearchaeota archaeon]